MASTFQKRGKWYVRFRDVTGKWRKKVSSARTREEALAFASELDLQADRQRLLPKQAPQCGHFSKKTTNGLCRRCYAQHRNSHEPVIVAQVCGHRTWRAWGGLCGSCHRRCKKYKLSFIELRALLDAHNTGCAACKAPHEAVDHDHITGAVRGLLCSKCNTALGLVGDRPEVLIALAGYLEKAAPDKIKVDH